MLGLFPLQALAQNPQPAFRNFTTNDGLPSSEAYYVLQDRDNYIWIATDNGLSRFDGYRFVNFSSSKGLLNPVVFYLLEDDNGRIWMNTLSNDIYYYEKDSIYAYPHNDIIREFHSPESISRDFYVTKDGTLYTNIFQKGLLEIKPNGDSKLITIEGAGGSIIKDFDEVALYQTTSVPDSLQADFKRDYIDRGIMPDLEIHGTEITRIKGLSKNYNGYRFLTSILKLKDQEYLMFNAGSLTYLKNTKLEWTIEFPHPITQNGFYKDDDGQLFLGAINEQGVFIYSDHHALLRGEGQHILKGYSVTSTLKDRAGGYWFSTLEQGVFYTPEFNLMIYDQRFGLTADLVTSLSVKNDELIWIALRNGDLFEINLKNNHMRKLPEARYDTENWGLIYDQKRKVLWKGSNNLNYFENGVWSEVYYFDEKEGRRRIQSGGNKRITVSRDGNFLWGADRQGFIKIDMDSKEVVLNSKSLGIHDRTLIVFEDFEERVWIGNVNGLFELVDDHLESRTFNHKALSLRIEDIAQLQDSSLVVGTKGAGVLLIQRDSIDVIDEKRGLSSNMIEHVYVDPKNQLWIGTLLGLNKITFDAQGEMNISQITTAHGLPSNEINKVRAVGDDVLIATSKGLARLSLEGSRVEPAVPIIEKVIVNNHVRSLEQPLKLTHQENNIAVHFFAIDFEQEGKINYRYKLKPINEEWIYSDNPRLSSTALIPNHYVFEVQSEDKDGAWSKSAFLEFEISKPFWKLWWFLLLVSCLVVFLLWAAYKTRLYQLNRENEIKQQIFDLERAALRAQMNPHFIFNVLSSIQYFILNDEKKAANRYLSQFARLVRSTLNHSRQSKITLENEIQIIEHYLSLEKMRFKDQFEYHIEVDEKLVHQDIEIPPMLIQPYLENALLHGIAPKKKNGMIEVHYSLDQSYLKVIVKDNGIGINQSKALKEKHRPMHESFGMHITKQRLELMNKGHRKEVFQVKELTDEHGGVGGTCVKIWIQLLDIS